MREETLDYLTDEGLDKEIARHQHIESTMRLALVKGLALMNLVQDPHQQALQAKVVKQFREALKS
jgi:hypothetical protein